jgi:hypothetical protein
MSEQSGFRGGLNIAMKLPPHLFEETERFYIETLGLPVLSRSDTSVQLEFGPNRLWLDRVPTMTQAEVWLEIIANDLTVADEQLRQAGTVRCDAVEPLPKDYPGFWITSPAQVVHLVVQETK